MFDLKYEVKQWKKTLRSQRSLEDGYIDEIEAHVIDEIDRLIEAGLSEEKAFNKAIDKIGNVFQVGEEFYKADFAQKVIKPRWKIPNYSPSLLSHNFKMAYRSLKRTVWYSSLNIIGLTIGMACSIIILLWVQSELSYDKFHKNVDHLYRAYQVQINSGNDLKTDNLPGPLAESLRNEFPEVKNTTRFLNIGTKPVKHSNKFFNEAISLTDPTFFEMFDFPLQEGSKDVVLSEPFSVVISNRIAKKYFEDENPLGKTLTIDNKNDFIIAGVLRDIPSNSFFRDVDVLIPFKNSKDVIGQSFETWGSNWPRTFIQLNEGTNVKSFEEKITNVLKDHQKSIATLHVQPIKNMRLYTLTGEGAFIKLLYIFLIIGFSILLIACINFINLSTARSKLRSKEVGLRKVTGAPRSSLIIQFLGESILMTILALIVASFAIYLSLPLINNFLKDLTGTIITFNVFDNQFTILALVSITILTGLFSGFYPAIYLSSFQPVEIFRKKQAGSGKSKIRTALVVLQFACSIVLIIFSLIISSQLEYLQNSELGYNPNNLIYIPLGGDSNSKYEALKSELTKVASIEEVTATSRLPLSAGNSSTSFEWDGKDPDLKVLINVIDVDPNYIEAMGMNMKEGEFIKRPYTSGSNETFDIIVNESAINRMGMKEPIGQMITNGNWKGRIVGVVNDFHFASFHQDIDPIIISADMLYTKFLLVRVNGNNIGDALDFIEDTWFKINPSTPFTYTFLDESIDDLYKAEMSTLELLQFFTVIAIIIACLGLLGLASFTAVNHTKEIGIRKVLGSSVFSIVILLTKGFSKWILVANLLAWPFAYYMANLYLDLYVYRTDIDIWVFIYSGIIAMSIAMLTVSYHTIKAALANPVKSLISE